MPSSTRLPPYRDGDERPLTTADGPRYLDASHATKLTYIDGRPATLTLRRLQVVVISDGKERTYTLDKDVVTIGTMEDNDIVLADDTVSRNHCRIWREGDHYFVGDLGSKNGTFVNRVRVREAYLSPDVTIRLGKSELRFTSVDERMHIVPSEKQRFGGLIGRNQKMREVYAVLEKIAPTDTTVVIEGETGTGKDVMARTLHEASARRDAPFIVFDCGAAAKNLIESDLFGHEKGAFTGAINARPGVFELAHGGTVFLDELGELALDLQPKLLRVLEQREVKRVGGSKPQKVDVRVIAATNRDLQKEVREGRFREDLYYRLSVVRVKLPPLRERKEDIPLLVRHFLKEGSFNRKPSGERKVSQVSRDAMDRLHEYDWPGNVRELLNAVESAVGFADGDTIDVGHLPEHIRGQRASVPPTFRAVEPAPLAAPVAPAGPATAAGAGGSVAAGVAGPPREVDGTFKDAKERWVASFERDYIAYLLRKNGNNISHAAREADIDRKYFRKLMKKYGLHESLDSEADDE